MSTSQSSTGPSSTSLTTAIRELREQTGAGVLACRQALLEAAGDPAGARELLRAQGLQIVAKRQDREAGNGLVAAHVGDGFGVVVKVACESDFVAMGAAMAELGEAALARAVADEHADIAGLLAEHVLAVSAATGEKVEITDVRRVTAPVVVGYLHRTDPDLPPQIGALVGATAPSTASSTASSSASTSDPRPLLADVALQVAAMAPADVAALLAQPFVKRPENTVGQLLAATGTQLTALARVAVKV